MRHGGFGAAGVFTAALAITVLIAGAPYPDRPPPGYTGGFGEPTCLDCHFEGELNEPRGAVSLEGVPDRYMPGERYRIMVVLAREGLRAGGFQLAARFAGGERAGGQAGVLAPVDVRTDLAEGPETRVQYLHHTLAGLEPSSPDTVRWELAWSAPDEGGDVVFHVAANAADLDASPFGDWIYTASVVTSSSAAQ